MRVTKIIGIDEQGHRFWLDGRDGVLQVGCDTPDSDDGEEGDVIDVRLSRVQARDTRDAIDRWLGGGNFEPDQHTYWLPAPESARATRAIDAIEAAGHQINLVADVYDRNRRGVHVVFFHLRNTYAMNDDGSFDMVGLANLRYLSELWAGTHGFNFAGCVYFHENASAPEDLSLVLEQLGDYRPIDMDMFKEVCVEYGTDPDDVEFDE